jgi:hypothetical protein
MPTESEPLRRERFCKSTEEEVAASGLGDFTGFAAEGFIDKKAPDRATRAEAESMNLLHDKSSGLVGDSGESGILSAISRLLSPAIYRL